MRLTKSTWLTPDHSLQWEVLEEHLSEAGFCWSQWELDLVAHDFILSEVADGDERRMWRHVQALILAGPKAAERILVPALEDDEKEIVVAAASAMLLAGQKELAQQVMEAFEASSEDCLGGLQRALELSMAQNLGDQLITLVDGENTEIAASALGVLTYWRGANPPMGLTKLCNSDDPLLRAAALAGMHQVSFSVAPAVAKGLEDPNPTVRARALELGLVKGLKIAWQAVHKFIESPDDDGMLARIALALAGEEADFQRLLSFLQVESLRRDTLWVLGFSGRLEAADQCLAWMADPKVGPRAAESFFTITGLPLENPFFGRWNLEPKEPTSDEAADDATKDDEIEAVASQLDEQAIESADQDDLDEEDPILDEDMGLPEPVPDKIEAWWQQSRSRFKPGLRHLYGTVFKPRDLPQAMQSSYMRRRAGLALELAIRTHGLHQVQTRASTWIQAQQIKAAQNQPSFVTLGPLTQAFSK